MAALERSTVRLFPPADEMLFLGLPVLFVAAAAVLGMVGWTFVPSDSNLFIDAVLMTIGLQSAHNVFTFSMIRLPEFKSWLGTKREVEHKDIVRRWVAIAVGLMVAYSILYHFITKWQTIHFVYMGGATPFQIFFFAFWVVNLRHTFGQIYGLSMLYNNTYMATLKDGKSCPPAVQDLLAFEKSIYQPYVWMFALYGAFWRVFSFKAWLSAAVLPGVLLIAAVIAPSLYYPAPLRRAKFLFNARLLFPLVLLIPGLDLLVYAMNLNHNFEYWMVYKKSVNTSRLHNRFSFLFVSTLGFILFVAMTLPRNEGYFSVLNLWFYAHPLLREFLIASTMTITTLHYFMDGDIFHFSDEITREHISPLLLGSLSTDPRVGESPLATPCAS